MGKEAGKVGWSQMGKPREPYSLTTFSPGLGRGTWLKALESEALDLGQLLSFSESKFPYLRKQRRG